MDTVQIKECVITTLTRRGTGDSGDSPIRIVTQVWAKTSDGNCELIAEHDPSAPKYDCLTGLFKGVNNEHT